jgi:S1-C subfamily serine protease
MLNLNVVLLCLVFVMTVPRLDAKTKTAEEIFSENRMAVVHVVMASDPSGSTNEPSAGTGFIIGSDGFVLTAKHVISGYVNATTTPIKVQIGSLDGLQVAAEPILFDAGIDAVLLKLRNPIGVGLTAYRAVERGDSSKTPNGEALFVVGFNFTSNISVVSGTLSSSLGGGIGGNLLWSVQAPGAMFGMSGAPVFDGNGRVVGILEGGQSGSGIVQVYPEQLLEMFASIPGWKRRQGESAHVKTGNTIVMDGNANYGQSGFSFARDLVVAWDSPDADLLVATADRSGSAQFFVPYDVPPYTAPQDARAHGGIRSVNAGESIDMSCPPLDYQFHWFPAQQGGTYCVRLRSGAKFAWIKVTGVFKDRISFEWALVE